MTTKSLIGLTIKEAYDKIARAESKADIFQVYICTLEHKERNFFKSDKKIHYYNKNGKRCYRVIKYDLRTYAKAKEPQNNSFILDAEITKEHHDNWSFNGYVNTASHNVYYLYVDGIKKDNKGREIIENKQETLEPYKDGELTKAQRRFIL